MIVWLNGAPGVGKSAAAAALVELLPGSTLYDPALIAVGLRAMLPRKRLDEVSDVCELPAWRRLVVDTAAALLAEVPGPLVVPLTLLGQEDRDEIFGSLAARRIDVQHVLLHSEETILRGALPPWLADDAYVLDTAGLGPGQLAEQIAEAVRTGAAACDIVQTPEPTAETVAAGVLFFDDSGRVLLVDPTYKPGWEFPGGVVEPGEAPARAGVREVEEELGLVLAGPPRLLVIDWEPTVPPRYGGLRLLFDGGRLTPRQQRTVLLPGPELRAWRFVTEDEAAELLSPGRARRLRWALRARELRAVRYLEAGEPVG